MAIPLFELRLEQTGRFLSYRGSPRPLPPGWSTWNAYKAGTLVGSLALASGPARQFNWDEADYEGPFFSPGPPPALLYSDVVVVRLECVYIVPSQRGGELWRRYADLLAALHLPVYLAFANAHLRDRLQAAHRSKLVHPTRRSATSAHGLQNAGEPLGFACGFGSPPPTAKDKPQHIERAHTKGA